MIQFPWSAGFRGHTWEKVDENLILVNISNVGVSCKTSYVIGGGEESPAWCLSGSHAHTEDKPGKVSRGKRFMHVVSLQPPGRPAR